MPVDMNLFLQNVYAALENQQYTHAQFLTESALKLSETSFCPLAPFDVSIGLHRGCVRVTNEDCLLAVQGTLPRSQEAFGLFVVCDGMGGHVGGQEAAHLATKVMGEQVLVRLSADQYGQVAWEQLLVESITQANHTIYQRNAALEEAAEEKMVQKAMNTAQMSWMGTTITAALLVGEVAYIANVGDSRTYLYSQGLRKLTNDHSVVAQYLASGAISEEESYTHPHRNKITRALGTSATVIVDTFVLTLPAESILLLCSDGLWEMTRDRHIEALLSSPWAPASTMARQLVDEATTRGGADNIGCIVVQMRKRPDISTMDTAIIDPVRALTRLVSSSFP